MPQMSSCLGLLELQSQLPNQLVQRCIFLPDAASLAHHGIEMDASSYSLVKYL